MKEAVHAQTDMGDVGENGVYPTLRRKQIPPRMNTLKMVLLPVSGEAGERIMKANPGVFHKTVFAKGSYKGVDSDVQTIAITAVLLAMDDFPAERLYQIVGAIFAHTDELAAVRKDAAKLTREKAITQVEPSALQYLHPGARKFFQ